MWGRILSAVAIVSFLYNLDFFSGQSNYGAFTEFSFTQIGERFVRQEKGAGAIFSPEATIIFLLYVIFFVLLNRNSFELTSFRKVHSLLRIGALLIDFTVLFPLIVIFMIITLLSIEAISTGNYDWSFIRGTRSITDTFYEIILGFGSFYLLHFYFYWHLKKQLPTIGQYLLGFKISHKEPISTFGCIVYVFSAVMHIPFFPIVLYKAVFRNVAWWDRKSEVEAVAVRASNEVFRTPF